MSRRSSSINRVDSGISREIGTDIEKVRIVAEHIDAVILAASVDLPALVEAIEKATDFEGITVVAGDVASWNPDTKVLTVPTIKGDKGDTGDSLRMTNVTPGPNGTFIWEFSDGSIYTTPSLKGSKGDKGDKGDTGNSLGITSIIPKPDGSMVWSFSDGSTYETPILKGEKGDVGGKGAKGDKGDALTFMSIIWQEEGVFLWTFSDGSQYTTPDLRGPRGFKGDQGKKGDQGISVHHMKGTNTTDPEGGFGTFGELDTYTFYGDADETIVLGWFSVRNGLSTDEQADALGLMIKKNYDTDGSGVVDNSERLEGYTFQDIFDFITGSLGSTYITENETDFDTAYPEYKAGDIVLVLSTSNSWDLRSIMDANVSTERYLSLISENLHTFVDVTTNLDTINQTLPKAINELQNKLSTKVDKVSGKELSTNDYTTAEKSKLVGIESGAQVNVGTNLSQGTRTATTVPINSSTGSAASILGASSTLAGVMTAADKVKLDGVESGAEVNTVDSVAGKTGAVTLVKSDVGLGAVDNTSDAAKPVSTAQQDALNAKLNISAIVNNLTTGGTAVPLSAEQGKVLKGLIDTINSVLQSDDGTLDELQEIVDYIKLNRAELDALNIASIAGLQAALDAKLNANDASVTNAREWTAATVSQAEAEAGVATTRRAWTAQRVLQAIAAWWAASASKTKLDGIEVGAQVNVATNLSLGTRTTTVVPVNSSTGTNVSLPAATTALAGVMSSADKTKLDSIEAGAQKNVGDEFSISGDYTNLRARATTKTDVGLSNVDNTSDKNKPVSIATQAALNTKVDNISGKGLSTEDFSSVEKDKLASINVNKIEQGATAYSWGDHSQAGYSTTDTKYTAGVGLDLAEGVFNVKFGTLSGTAAQGNDSRINNGATAYSWGNHASAGYTLAINLATVATSGSYNDLSDKPAGGGGGSEWLANITANYTIVSKDMISVTATSAIIDITQPATIANPDFIIIHNNADSLYDVRLLNPTRTIKSANKSVTGDNLLIKKGETMHLLALSPTQWEVI